MTIEQEFPDPLGNPGALRTAGSALNKVATDVTWSAAGLTAEVPGLAKAWTGGGGKAANAETTAAANLTKERVGNVTTGASAFTEYGSALDHAKGEVVRIRQRALAMENDKLSDIGRIRGIDSTERAALRRDAYTSTINALRPQYDATIAELGRAAKAAAAKLTGVVPNYKQGMSAADAGSAARAAAAAKLAYVQKLDGQRLGQELADKALPYLQKGKQLPPELLDQIEQNQANPYFGKAFLEKLGPDKPGWAMAVMNASAPDPKYNQRVLTLFGKLIAQGTTATDPQAKLSDAYVDGLLKPLDAQNAIGADYAWKMSHLLHYGGTFGRDFLKKYGDKLYTLDKTGNGDHADFSLGRGVPMHRSLVNDDIPWDPMEEYFTHAAKQPLVAQDFFAGHPDRLKFYLVDREVDTYTSQAMQPLADTLTAATTKLRDGGPDGQRSAQITADMVNVLGQEDNTLFLDGDHKLDKDKQAVVKAIAGILNNYGDDVFLSIGQSDYSGVTASAARQGNPILGGDKWGADFNAGALRTVLSQVDGDTDAYRTIVDEQLKASSRYLDAKLEQIGDNPAARENLLRTYARSHGLVLKTLFDTHINNQQAIGALEDLDKLDATRRMDGAASSVLLIASLAPPLLVPSTVLFAGKVVVFPFLYENITHDLAAEAGATTASAKVNEWYSATLQNMIVQMQNGGGFDGTPAEASTWLDKQGYDPKDSFVDGNGDLLDPAKLTPGQTKALQAWLIDQGETGVRPEMSDMFTALDAAGGKQTD